MNDEYVDRRSYSVERVTRIGLHNSDSRILYVGILW